MILVVVRRYFFLFLSQICSPPIQIHSRWIQISQRQQRSKNPFSYTDDNRRKNTFRRYVFYLKVCSNFAYELPKGFPMQSWWISRYIENILFVTTIRSVRKIGITGRMYLLQRNTQYRVFACQKQPFTKKILTQFLYTYVRWAIPATPRMAKMNGNRNHHLPKM